jgi:hypothetical protein
MKKTHNLKNIALLLLLIVLAGMVKAQHSSGREYDNLAMENRAWIHMFRSDYDDTVYYQLGIAGDTMVNSMEYKKLIECSHLGFPIEGQCVGGIRTDGNGKYFFVLLEPTPAIGHMYICLDNQDQEVLLYDFSLSVLDDWDEPCFETGCDFVIEVFEEDFGGIMRKTLKFSDGYRWIEGVGCTEGLLFPINEDVPLCGISHRTVEVFQEGESIYKDPEFMGIDYTNVSEWSDTRNRVSLFPNPVKNKVHLQYLTDTKPTRIELYDPQGHLVYTQQNNFESIDLSQLTSGTYTTRIILEDGKSYTDKVVKE